MVTTGKRFTPKEIERYIDAVTTDEIKRVATKYLWDKDVSDLFQQFCYTFAYAYRLGVLVRNTATDVRGDAGILLHVQVETDTDLQFALAAVGRTEALLDYNRIRSGMFLHHQYPSTQVALLAEGRTDQSDMSSMLY